MTDVSTLAASRTPRRTQAERRDESERKLVRAAITVVAESGVSAATFEAIGRRAGYSRGLAGQRFGSKLGLVEAVIDHLHDLREASLIDHRLDAMPGLEAVLTYNDLYLQALSASPEFRAYFMLLSSAVAEAAAFRSAFAAEHGRVQARLADLVRRGQAEGDIRADLDPDSAALMIGGLQLGLSMQLLVDPAMDLGPIRKTAMATLRLSFSADRQT